MRISIHRSNIKPQTQKTHEDLQSATVSRLGGAVASLILLTLFNLSWRAVAAPVTAKDAATAVANWLIVDPMPLGENLGGTVQQVIRSTTMAAIPIYYIVYLDPSAFVIVAADDLVEPIVGFARAGQYDPSEDNPLGALVSNDLPARVAYAQQSGSASRTPTLSRPRPSGSSSPPTDGGPVICSKVLTSVSDVRVAPFTQTTWDQQTASGVALPPVTITTLRLTGPATSTTTRRAAWRRPCRKLMRYYQFPTTSIGTASFSITVDGSRSSYTLQGGGGAGGAYVWSNMPLVPPASPTTCPVPGHWRTCSLTPAPR